MRERLWNSRKALIEDGATRQSTDYAGLTETQSVESVQAQTG